MEITGEAEIKVSRSHPPRDALGTAVAEGKFGGATDGGHLALPYQMEAFCSVTLPVRSVIIGPAPPAPHPRA